MLAGLPLQDEVLLGEGRSVRGTIVKETEEEVFVDIGHTILAIPKSGIVEVLRDRERPAGDEEARVEVRELEIWTETDRPPLSVRENVERIGAGVVLVRVPGALGSGFVINDRGHVVTNAHVIAGERNITVTLFESTSDGFDKTVVEDVEIVAVNPYWDLALLKLPEASLEALTLRPIPFAQPDEVRVGDPVFAIGNPLGLERTVSEGIVSTTSRAQGGQLYVQTTAAVNGGNSGGPLLDLEGQVVGVIAWHVPGGEGLNFAIPVATLRAFLEHRDAFAYDKDRPNTGYRYLEPPRKGSGRDDA